MLQRIPWVVGNTYDEICQTYTHYLLSNYGTANNITVVFDGGYLIPSTKDPTHLRRSNGKLGRKVVPALHTPLTVKKSDFLLSTHNKQAFLLILGSQLSDSGINVVHSDGDADVDIVCSALRQAENCVVTLVGEDTDLLVLLLWHYDSSLHHPVYLYSNTSKTAFDIKKSNLLLGDELTQSILAISCVMWL